MNTKKTITKEDIERMSYTDFVGFVNQWNVLPGSYVTLSEWVAFSGLDKDSRILELACTSGFSSRELSILSGCSGVGIDISEASVEMAEYNRQRYAPSAAIEYKHGDGDTFQAEERFSHVIVGAALKFFPDPEATLKRIASEYLKDGGLLLASPFYVTRPIPDELVKKAHDVFGITITTEKYHEIRQQYSDLEILYENRRSIEQEGEGELAQYCESTVRRACEIRSIQDDEIRSVMYERLLEIRRMSNELRPYQEYSILVLRYRKDTYPNRYTELF